MRRVIIERQGNEALVRDIGGGLGIVDLIVAGVAAAGTAASIAAQAVMQKKAQAAAKKAQSKQVAENKRQEEAQRAMQADALKAQYSQVSATTGGDSFSKWVPYLAIGGAALVGLALFASRR